MKGSVEKHGYQCGVMNAPVKACTTFNYTSSALACESLRGYGRRHQILGHLKFNLAFIGDCIEGELLEQQTMLPGDCQAAC